MGHISENIREVIDNIRQSALKVNRDPAEIRLVAVTKTVPVNRITEAVNAGLNLLGENRVQELTDKYTQLPGVEWHLIGHLQTNKVRYIIDKVSLIHSLDSLALAEEINKRALAAGRTNDVLVQVNVAGENTKYGLNPVETVDFIDTVRKLPGLAIRGLMTVGPYVSDPEEIRPVFRKLKMLAEQIKTMDLPGVEMKHLSMGMSNDYKVAVEEGATLVRVGSVIFGERN